jgi:hypothetical protein
VVLARRAGQPFSFSVITALASLPAASGAFLPVSSALIMSVRAFELSTAPQFGLLGTNQPFLAAAAGASMSGSFAATSSRVFEFGMTLPCSTRSSWYLVASSLSH